MQWWEKLEEVSHQETGRTLGSFHLGKWRNWTAWQLMRFLQEGQERHWDRKGTPKEHLFSRAWGEGNVGGAHWPQQQESQNREDWLSAYFVPDSGKD